MISIGNDIVAIDSINRQRSNDIRFHSKFITATELTLYQKPSIAVIPFESFVWLLWSVKESVYKYQKRFDPELVFSPTKIVIQHVSLPAVYTDVELTANAWEGKAGSEGFYRGEVVTEACTLYFRSVINDDLVASIVNDEPTFQNVYWGIQRIDHPDYESQSRSVRRFLLNRLKSTFPQGHLSLQKSPVGYPVLLLDEKDTCVAVSLAHHELFTSYCFKLSELNF